MVKKYKKLLSKKVKGMSEFLSTLICLGVIFTFVMAIIYTYGGIIKEEDIHRIHRKYLLSMEREGYLTPSYEAALIADLTAEGATNIVLAGTSNAPVGYGQTVILRIECDIPVDKIQFSSMVGRRTGGTKHVVVEKEATAFY